MQGQFSDVPQVQFEQQAFKAIVASNYGEFSKWFRAVCIRGSSSDWLNLRSSLLVLYFDVFPKISMYEKDYPKFKDLKVLDYFVQNPTEYAKINEKGQFQSFYPNESEGGKLTFFGKIESMKLAIIIREFLEVNGVTRYEEERAKTSLDRS